MERRSSGWVTGIAILVAVILLLFFGFGAMGYGMFGPGMMGGYGPYGYGVNPWWGILTLVFWLLIIGGIVALVVWAVRGWQPARAGGPRESTALEVLKQRYARGEISQEEYERMKQDLL